MYIVGMVVWKNREVETCWGIEEGSVNGGCKDNIFNKSRIGSWKLTEGEERIFGGDCTGGCMHKKNCENDGAPTIL